MATIVLVSLCTLSVSAADGGRVNVKTPAALVGAPLASAPAVAAPAVDDLYLFVRGTDNACWWKHFDGSAWTDWTSLGGALSSAPTAIAASASGRSGVVISVRGTDGGIWARAYSPDFNSWSSWQGLGGQLYADTGPGLYASADASGNGIIGVFVTGTDQALWHQYYNAGALMAGSTTGSGWQYLGGVLTSTPAAVATSPSSIMAFGRGSDAQLWYRSSSSSGWSGWQSPGGQLLAGTGPAIVVSNKIDVYVTGTDNAVWYKSYTGTWSSWGTIGGLSNYSPSATREGTSFIDVFVTGTDGNLWWRYSPGPTATWSNWLSVGSGPL